MLFCILWSMGPSEVLNTLLIPGWVHKFQVSVSSLKKSEKYCPKSYWPGGLETFICNHTHPNALSGPSGIWYHSPSLQDYPCGAYQNDNFAKKALRSMLLEHAHVIGPHLESEYYQRGTEPVEDQTMPFTDIFQVLTSSSMFWHRPLLPFLAFVFNSEDHFILRTTMCSQWQQFSLSAHSLGTLSSFCCFLLW